MGTIAHFNSNSLSITLIVQEKGLLTQLVLTTQVTTDMVPAVDMIASSMATNQTIMGLTP